MSKICRFSYFFQVFLIENFQRLQNQRQILRFSMPILNCWDIFYSSYLFILKILKPNAHEQRNNIFYKCVIKFNFSTISPSRKDHIIVLYYILIYCILLEEGPKYFWVKHASIQWSHKGVICRYTYWETGELARLAAQLPGRWEQRIEIVYGEEKYI